MRTRRLLISSLLAVSALTALVPAALGARASTQTFRDSFQLTDEHENEAYVFDVETIAHITIRRDGTTSITNNTKQVQTHLVGGVVVDVIESNMAQHSLVEGEDIVLVSHTSGHDRYTGDGAACQTTTVWQVVDNDLVLVRFHSVCH
jgi:hypothetical protein